jgi:hypothetical protein
LFGAFFTKKHGHFRCLSSVCQLFNTFVSVQFHTRHRGSQRTNQSEMQQQARKHHSDLGPRAMERRA